MKEAAAPAAKIIPFDDLPHNPDAHRFAGGDHGDVPFSFVVVHSQPGSEPVMLHRHPYPEVFVVLSGEATFTVGDETAVVPAGHIAIGPADIPHGFRNTGTDELRMVNIHGSAEFVTEWLSENNRG